MVAKKHIYANFNKNIIKCQSNNAHKVPILLVYFIEIKSGHVRIGTYNWT